MFEKIKKFYDLGLYSVAMVQKFADKGVITAEQAAQIVSEK